MKITLISNGGTVPGLVQTHGADQVFMNTNVNNNEGASKKKKMREARSHQTVMLGHQILTHLSQLQF